MMRGGAWPWAAGLACSLLLAGCQSTVQETFGIGKRAPDEFQIVRTQPLIIPPDATLRPPRPGEPGPAEVSTADQAREVLTGTAAPAASSTRSPGESALLADTRVQADPGIRQTLLEENTELTSIDESRFLTILDFQRRRSTPQPDVINPAEEAARLREQGISSTGPVTVQTGSTPLTPGSS
jgi:hypothetical protein